MTRRLTSLVVLVVLAGCSKDAATTAPGSNTDFPSDPAQAQLITDDVDRYWRAYDAGGRSGSTAVFQSRYLDSASAGLREMIRIRSVTAASLSQVTSVYPRYLDALRDWWRASPNKGAVLATIRANYTKLEQRYPDAVYPPVTVLVGRYSTGGTVGASGLLIGAEFFGVDANAPLGELNTFARENQKSWTRDLPVLVAHEHTHYLTAAVRGRTSGSLLAASLSEGIAEFLAEQIAGAPTFKTFFIAWQARELEFWQAFDREKNGTDTSRWLYNQGSGTAAWPGDLGYFIGYRIAQAYYAKAPDKTQALRELIALRDPAAILAASGYAGTGPVISPD
jgi:hypothetical protein